MGWDIVFQAEFPAPESAAERFRGLWEALKRRSGFIRCSSFKVSRSIDLCSPLLWLGGSVKNSVPVTEERVKAALDEYSSDDVAIGATWKVEGKRGGSGTSGGVTAVTYGPALRYRRGIERCVDLTWDIGDSRRYTAEGLDDYPNVEQVMAEIPVLVDLGADSIWGVDAEGVVSPRHLFAVYHRDANRYHEDGIEPPFPNLPIDTEMVLIAAAVVRGVSSDQRTLETSEGPLVYHEGLAGGRLSVFYEGLRGVLLADAEGVE